MSHPRRNVFCSRADRKHFHVLASTVPKVFMFPWLRDETLSLLLMTRFSELNASTLWPNNRLRRHFLTQQLAASSRDVDFPENRAQTTVSGMLCLFGCSDFSVPARIESGGA